MTGLSTLLVELDDGTGMFPYDVSAYVDKRAGWSLDRGRQDELGEVDPAVARLTFNNNDGRFTLGSPAYGIVVDQGLRITETFGATTSQRFTGYVQDWPVRFPDPTAQNVPCAVTAVDRQSRLSRRRLRPALVTEQLADDPQYLYSLGEAVGATTAGDSSPNMRRALQIAGTGGALTFGTTTTADQTAATFVGGKYLTRQLTSLTSQTFEVSFSDTTVPSTNLSSLVSWDNGIAEGTAGHFGLTIRVYTTGVLAAELFTMDNLGGSQFTAAFSTDSLVDGALHHVAVRANGATFSLMVDGVEVDSNVFPYAALPHNRVSIGQTTATVLGVATYAALLTDATLQRHYHQLAATPTPDSSDERVARLAGYAGLVAGDLELEVGVLTSVPSQSLAGAGLWEAMSTATKAEGGSLFIGGDGKLVMHNRYHRLVTATGSAQAALEAGDIEHDDLVITADKQYLQNTVDGTREGGATQGPAINQASIDAHDEYPDSMSLLVNTDDEVLDRINWQVQTYGTPLPRLNSVTVDLLTLDDDAKVAALLALELGDRLTIADLPPQSPVSSADLLVEGMSERQSFNQWSLTFNTVPAENFRAWLLGDATYGVLGTTTRLHF